MDPVQVFVETVQQKSEQLLGVLLLEAVKPRGVLRYGPLERKTLQTRKACASIHTDKTDSVCRDKRIRTAYSEFKWGHALLGPAPQLHHQISVTLGHVTSHPDGVDSEGKHC